MQNPDCLVCMIKERSILRLCIHVQQSSIPSNIEMQRIMSNPTFTLSLRSRTIPFPPREIRHQLVAQKCLPSPRQPHHNNNQLFSLHGLELSPSRHFTLSILTLLLQSNPQIFKVHCPRVPPLDRRRRLQSTLPKLPHPDAPLTRLLPSIRRLYGTRTAL